MPSFIWLKIIDVCKNIQRTNVVAKAGMTNSVSVHLTKNKLPVDAVVAVVLLFTVLSVLSVGVVGVDTVDCDSVVEVVGVVALSEKSTVTHFAVDKAALQTNFIFVEINQSINQYIL